jgi:hypothetical protein
MALKLRRKRVMFAWALLLVMLAVGCSTQPATDVTSQTAVLNVENPGCPNSVGYFLFQIRDVTDGQAFRDVGPAQVFGQCSGTLNPYRVTGLQPDHLHEFRIKAMVNGAMHYFDADGNSGGTNYDRFRTKPVNFSVTDQPPPPGEVSEPCGAEACDAAIRKAKYGLKNPYSSWFRSPFLTDFEWWGARVTTDWGYTLGPYDIRWKKSHAVFWISGAVGDVEKTFEDWPTNQCAWGPGGQTCLTRKEYQMRLKTIIITPVGQIHINSYQWGCMGTRINGNGSHSRNSWGARCDNPPGGSSSTTRVQSRASGASIGKPVVGLEDFVSERMAKRIKDACWRQPTSSASAECKAVLLKAYDSLTPKQKRAVSSPVKRPTACAALSPRSTEAVSPNSPCVRRSSQ